MKRNKSPINNNNSTQPKTIQFVLNLLKYLEYVLVKKYSDQETSTTLTDYDNFMDEKNDEFYGITIGLNTDETWKVFPDFMAKLDNYIAFKHKNGRKIDLISQGQPNIEGPILENGGENILYISEISKDKILVITNRYIYIKSLRTKEQFQRKNIFNIYMNINFILEIFDKKYIVSCGKIIYYLEGELELEKVIKGKIDLSKEILSNDDNIYYYGKILDCGGKKIFIVINKKYITAFNILNINKSNKDLILSQILEIKITSDETFNENNLSIISYDEGIMAFLCMSKDKKILVINFEKQNDKIHISEDKFKLENEPYSIWNIRTEKEYLFRKEEEKISNYFMVGFEGSIKIYYIQPNKKIESIIDLPIGEGKVYKIIPQNGKYLYLYVEENGNKEFKKYCIVKEKLEDYTIESNY